MTLPVNSSAEAPITRTRTRPWLIAFSLARFVTTGGASFAVDAGTLWVLHGLFDVWLPAATLCGVVLSFVLNFVLNRQWVFAANGSAVRQLRRYLVLAVSNWIITVSSVTALVGLGAHYLTARIGVLAVMTVVNFTLYRVWVFVRPETPAEVN
ncbi:GtrA family protein [Micromonospora sp. NPDC049175]|uniref:GtrA family protein n=1 Tax=unclassified Micromonospora TaxID=2617518 RepID=UPI00372427A0